MACYLYRKSLVQQSNNLAICKQCITALCYAKRYELGLSSDHHSLVIFDRFKGQCTDVVLKALEENNIDVLLIPANCTDRLQLLDISIN